MQVRVQAVLRFGAPLTLFLLLACGGGLPVPPIAAESPRPTIPVPRPPPVAVPETVPDPPEEAGDWVWVDGSWRFGLGRWVWNRGGWVNLPQGAAYFRGGVVYTHDGRILYWEPDWVNDQGRAIEPPPIAKPALTPRAERTVEGLL